MKVEDNMNTKYLFLASIYLDINEPVVSEALLKVTQHCHTKGIPLLIGMDSNDRSGAW